jgi:hypothetical protein
MQKLAESVLLFLPCFEVEPVPFCSYLGQVVLAKYNIGSLFGQCPLSNRLICARMSVIKL